MVASNHKISKILDRSVDNKNIFGTVVCISRDSGSKTYAAGNLTEQSQYFIASVTKLFVTAIIQQLRQRGKIGLDDRITQFLSNAIMKELHVYKGVDYSNYINIRHLLSHTSGLPDYFLQRKGAGISLVKELIAGKDQKWTCEEAVQISKSMQPHFEPGKKGKAFYSDTNFQLLGKIIEASAGLPLSEVLNEYILDPLHLKKTYLYEDVNDQRPAEIFYRTNHARIPLAMTSFWADGSIVSTAGESVKFLKAFFNGQLFPGEYINEMQNWNRIFFPFQYGTGIARFKLPWFFTPFRSVPEIIGHMGTTGAFAYYCPKKETTIAGTINQVHNPGLPYKLIMKILQAL